jgi:hypothetical protein
VYFGVTDPAGSFAAARWRLGLAPKSVPAAAEG